MEPDSWFRDLDGTGIMGDSGNGSWNSKSSSSVYHGSTNPAPHRPLPPSSYKHSHQGNSTGGPTDKSSPLSLKRPPPPSSVPHDNLAWYKIMYDYTQASSLHGLRFITEGTTFTIRRIIWFVIFGVAFGVFISYVSRRVKFYLEFNKNVNVEVNYLPKVKFPAVTFCNENPFRITTVAEKGWYHMINRYLYTSAPAPIRNCTSDEFSCVVNSECVPVSMRCDLYPDCDDGSDEKDCDPCPMLYLAGPTEYETDIPGVLNQYYDVQSNTWNTSTPVYIQTTTGSVFLYADENDWILGNNFNGEVVYGYINSDAPSPQHINTSVPWTLNLSTGSVSVDNISMQCSLANMHLLGSFDDSIVEGLDLQTMYEEAGHRKEEFIQKCEWKGKECDESAIQQKYTDMGVCYTFNSDDMYVEQSGPGYGLSLTANIEQYEYTKSTDEGIGIKLLMHDPSDEPLMKEQGTSVSPGLYSFISIETTQVTNLEPPWGSCGSKTLKYYPTGNYTIARCTLECEVDYINDVSDCGCRDLHMPGARDVCGVSSYINCTKPALDELKAAGNYCTCPTPCMVKAFVPTTSFSIVLSEGGGGSQDEKTQALKEKVSRARETTYRVVVDKYLETMRHFHLLQTELKQTSRFAHASSYLLATEYNLLQKYSSYIRADCVWIHEKIEEAHTYIDSYFIKPIVDFKEVLSVRGVKVIQEIKQYIVDAKGRVNGSTNDDFMDGVERYVWVERNQAVESMTLMKNEMWPNLKTTVSAIPAVDEFQIQSSVMTHLNMFIGMSCSWCHTSGSQSLVDILKNKIEDLVDNDFGNNLKKSKNYMKNIHDPYLIDLEVLNRTEDVPYSEWTDFLKELNKGLDEAEAAMTKLTSALEYADEAKDYIEHILLFVWNQKCQTEVSKLVREYETGHTATMDLFDAIAKYYEDAELLINNYRESYRNSTMTLEKVAGSIPFKDIISITNGLKVRLDSSLIDRILVLEDLHRQINSVHYTLLSVTGMPELAGFSPYWQIFSTTSPSLQHPTSSTVNGVTVTDDKYQVVPRAGESLEWTQLTTNIKDVQAFLQKQYDATVLAITSSETYFTSYLEGNDLTGDFYSKNFLQVELFYKELTERKVSQQVAYNYENLLSELGGLMGLLLGASVLSIFEFIDLFVFSCFRKCFCAKDRVKPSKIDNAW